MAAGLVGALFYAAFGAFECKKCGKVPRREFSSNVQIKMAMGTLLLIGAAIALAIGVFALMDNMR